MSGQRHPYGQPFQHQDGFYTPGYDQGDQNYQEGYPLQPATPSAHDARHRIGPGVGANGGSHGANAANAGYSSAYSIHDPRGDMATPGYSPQQHVYDEYITNPIHAADAGVYQDAGIYHDAAIMAHDDGSKYPMYPMESRSNLLPSQQGNGTHTPYDYSAPSTVSSGTLVSQQQKQQQRNQWADAPAMPPMPANNANGPQYGVTIHDDYGYGDPGSSTPFVPLGAPGMLIASGRGGGGGFGSFIKGGSLRRDPTMHTKTRQRVLHRREVKQIELTQGNLVIDVPVAPSICKSSQTKEMTMCRYTAATCDPDDFTRERYSLRPWLFGRETELAIVLTSYNEDEQLLCKTLNGTIKNIQKLCEKKNSSTWGPEGWKKVVVCVVADGRTKADPRFLKVLSLMGAFQEGAMKSEVLGKAVTAHIFEFTTQVLVEPDGSVQVLAVPVQIVFCLKEKNHKKINSHRWFFRAFCQQLNPHVCMLLDVGTKPGGTSLIDLWRTFKNSPNVGGACGEIRTDVGKFGVSLFNPLVAAQNFEYKMSNILDKPLESVFGFISVLPGAFSAYRWKALQGQPLESYFKGEALHSGAIENPGSFVSNMYLAEDRILCFEIAMKRHEKWTLRYVKSAFAVTDVPTQVAELISQRRRWNNGSLFAAFYAVVHFGRIWTSGHNFLRKLWLQVQALYNLAQLIFSFTALANFFLAFYFLLTSASTEDASITTGPVDAFGGQGDTVSEVLPNLFIALIVVTLVLSLGNRPAGSKWVYTSVIFVFAALMGVALYCAGFAVWRALQSSGLLSSSGWTSAHALDLLRKSNFRDIVVSLAATYLLYLLTSIVYLDPWHMLTSFMQYLLLMPMFTIVIGIYSNCNLHDVSWGTKGENGGGGLDAAAPGKTSKEGKQTVEVRVPTSAQDAEDLWRSTREDLAAPLQASSDAGKRSNSQRQADHAANFRTHFVLVWLAVNASLAIVFTSTAWKKFVRNHLGSDVADPYMSALFWSTAGLSSVRAIGSVLYITGRFLTCGRR